MSISSPVIRIASFDVDVVRKDIKNLYLRVYPPFGQVQVAVPLALDDEAVRLAVIARTAWIHKWRNRMLSRPRHTQCEMIDGESHHAWGHLYRLHIVEDGAQAKVTFSSDARLQLHVRKGADREAREKRLTEWYRDELKATIPGLVGKWSPLLGIAEPSWRIRQMKTRWGTCNINRARIWLNLELSQKAPECLEYVVVHELVHLLERNHNRRFYDLMNYFMPHWRSLREKLNRAPLISEECRPDSSF
ncbi:MAG: M48 family metallopeptidase [Candidatus Dormibacteraceae bacterium]